MIAVIDSGNSSIKLGIFKEGKLIQTYNSGTVPEILSILSLHPVKKLVISDVGGRSKELRLLFPEKPGVRFLHPGMKFSFKILYDTPETLGTDRIAAVAGAWNRFPGTDILIIDAGTCITYDFINKEGNYLGGGISPGIHLRLKSLHSFTSGLPEVNFENKYNLFGSDTTSSILSGTLGGVAAELNGMIQLYRENYPGLNIIICGGSVVFFESKIKGSIFVIPDLVLLGLWVIAENNEI